MFPCDPEFFVFSPELFFSVRGAGLIDKIYDYAKSSTGILPVGFLFLRQLVPLCSNTLPVRPGDIV